MLAGCMNPYRANFNSTFERTPIWMENRVGPKTAKPRLVTSNDLASDNWRFYEQGYIMIGFSKFDGAALDPKLAVEQARAVGADMVAVQNKYSKTLTETVTVTQWPSTETTDIQEDTSLPGGRRISRRTEVRTSRTPETVYVPKQVDYFEHSATFWRKLEKPVFGAFVQDLPDDQKRKLQSNQGVVVRAIMTGSPAFEADLLKGDFITAIDGKGVAGAQKFYQQLSANAGRRVELTVLRGASTFQRRVVLNP